MRLFRKEPELPSKVEKMILSGVSYSKCVKELKTMKDFEGYTPNALKTLVYTEGSRLLNENQAKQFEKHVFTAALRKGVKRRHCHLPSFRRQ